MHFAGVFHCADDGLIRSIHEYARPEDALEAVGLSEHPLAVMACV